MTQPVEQKPLELTIALDTLRHLGINLYSSLPPVLSELVANAYDARARRVDITLGSEEVTIEDDGIGMTRTEVQEKYLVVGRDRRLLDPQPPSGSDPFEDWPIRNKPMGRKGIGKLAMFSIANEVEVGTVRAGSTVAIRMEREQIEDAAKAGRAYNPAELAPDSSRTKGTRIVLRRLRRRNAPSADIVLRALARRFSIIDLNNSGGAADQSFQVYVNGTMLGLDHWDVFKKLQCLWYLGADSKEFADRCAAACTTFEVGSEVEVAGSRYSVSGWLGTVTKPRQLKSKAEEVNDNRILIDCRGKVAIADFLPQFAESGVYVAYLTGYLRADFLDDDDDDIATSDRERMREDDPRVAALREFVWGLLKRIHVEWSAVRRRKGEEDARSDSVIGPTVTEWLEGMNADERSDAQALLGRLATTRFAEVGDRAQVLRYSILAFERLRVRKQMHILREVSDDRLGAVATMLALESDLENALYADVAGTRLDVVKTLDGLVEANAKEKVIQKHVFDHLWLLEPGWTIQDQLDARLEERVRKEFREVGLGADEDKWRIDIRYRRSGGQHIIVELKRAGASITVGRLIDQVGRYKNVLKRCLLEAENLADPDIRSVCLVGTRPSFDRSEDEGLRAMGIEVRSYEEVITTARKAFADFLNASQRFGRVQGLLTKLDALESSTDEA